MKNLYLPSGYVNIPALIALGLPWTLVVGARATGKTYGACRHILQQEGSLFLRRTQAQCDLVSSPEFSPFNPVLVDDPAFGPVCYRKLSKNSTGIYHAIEADDGTLSPRGAPCCITAAVSTFSSMRGFDASSVRLCVYDEFIPEPHERLIKNEGAAILNIYETINRNRELKGRDPLQMLCLANSNTIANPLMIELGLVTVVDQMRRRGKTEYINRDRGIAIFDLSDSPISRQKADTALYRSVVHGSEFEAMALRNSFTMEDITVRPIRLQELRPWVQVGELTVYTLKSSPATYYVSAHRSGSPAQYGTSQIELKRFRQDTVALYNAYVAKSVIYESYNNFVLLDRYYKM